MRVGRYLILCAVELAIIGWLGFLIVQRNSSEIIVTSPNEDTPAYTLVFAGDMMFDRNIANQVRLAGDPLYPVARIAETLRSADLAVANLEGPISTRGVRQGSIYSFRFDPAVAIPALQFAGIDLVSLANNHVWDYGRQAALDTMEHLRQDGISYIGFGRNALEANTPVIKKVGEATVAFIGYTEFYGEQARAGESAGLSTLASEEITSRIKDLRAAGQVDLIVVQPHWGQEYEVRASEAQRALAREWIDSGADLVVGHHPHVPQEVERYEGGLPAGRQGWIAYSLGNFVFDQNFSPDTQRGLMLKVSLLGKSIEKVEPIEIRFTETFQPYVP
jgi:poly-gamma-glutamate capsule biosynthesis protein CapA/YwtB (metallophosphatase superfamily)